MTCTSTKQAQVRSWRWDHTLLGHEYSSYVDWRGTQGTDKNSKQPAVSLLPCSRLPSSTAKVRLRRSERREGRKPANELLLRISTSSHGMDARGSSVPLKLLLFSTATLRLRILEICAGMLPSSSFRDKLRISSFDNVNRGEGKDPVNLFPERDSCRRSLASYMKEGQGPRSRFPSRSRR